MTSEYEQELEVVRATLQEHEEKKKDIIKRLVRLLEKSGLPPDMIASTLGRDLEGYVTSRYIRAILDEEYKQKSKVREQEQEQKKEILTTTDGSQQIEDSYSHSRNTSANNKPEPELESKPSQSATLKPPPKHQKVEIEITFGNVLALQKAASQHRTKATYLIEYDMDIKQMTNLFILK